MQAQSIREGDKIDYEGRGIWVDDRGNADSRDSIRMKGTYTVVSVPGDGYIRVSAGANTYVIPQP